MAPHNTQSYSQSQPSHPYSVASTSQLNSPPIDPKLANLKVIPPAGSRPPSLLASPQSYPPGPQADPKQILAVVARGLESLIDRGTIDARPSRQGVAQPRVGACSACRESKVRQFGIQSADQDSLSNLGPSLCRRNVRKARRARGVCRTTCRACTRCLPSGAGNER